VCNYLLSESNSAESNNFTTGTCIRNTIFQLKLTIQLIAGSKKEIAVF